MTEKKEEEGTSSKAPQGVTLNTDVTGITGSVIGIVIMGAVIWFMVKNSLTGGAPEVISKDRTLSAHSHCQGLVEKRLVSPASAKFPHVREAHIGDGIHLIDSYVDSQNKFGAMLRTPYTCKIQYLGDDKWQPLALNM